MTPRPVRNNNPGDLETGDHWQGLMPADRLTDAQKHERFATFESPKWGFRALVVVLRNYKMLHSADTVQKIVDRFAPPVENNTAAYVSFIADKLGVRPTAQINVTIPKVMFTLAKYITKYETGSWEPFWHDSDLTAGMALAGYDVGELNNGMA